MLRTVTTTADGGPGSLRRAIAQANSGDTITFAPSLARQTITLSSPLTIPAGRQLTIDGRAATGVILNGGGRHRILQVNSNQAAPTALTLRGLTLANGFTAQRGGAVHLGHRGQLTVANVNFRNNVANEGGGAIFTSFEGRLRVFGSQFVNNQAVAGNNERGAGAIAYWGPNPLEVRNSTFINNLGINGGAINSLNAPLTIQNTRFFGNRTTTARFDTGNPRPFLRGYGGAIYVDRASSASNATAGTITITGSTFGNNRGRGEGGAAYLYTGSQDRVIVTNSRFQNNGVAALPGGRPGYGGAIVQLSDGLNRGFTVNNTLFTGNVAAEQGGGIWTRDAPTTINASTFSGNRTTGQTFNSFGGGMMIDSPTTINGSIFANNRAGWVGGALTASRNDRVAVGNSIFFNNTADNGPNDWNIQQHTNRELVDLGNNFQFPPRQTSDSNDNNVTATIRTDVNPQLILQPNGTFVIGNPAVSLQPPAAAKGSLIAAGEDTLLGQSGMLVGEGDRLLGHREVALPLNAIAPSGRYSSEAPHDEQDHALAAIVPAALTQGRIEELSPGTHSSGISATAPAPVEDALADWAANSAMLEGTTVI